MDGRNGKPNTAKPVMGMTRRLINLSRGRRGRKARMESEFFTAPVPPTHLRTSTEQCPKGSCRSRVQALERTTRPERPVCEREAFEKKGLKSRAA